MTPHDIDDEEHDHDRGLAFDLPRLIGRRRALQVLGGASLLALVGCASSDNGSSAGTTAGSGTAGTTGTTGTSGTAATTGATGATSATAAATTGATGDVDVIPEETAGPYPADGSNGPNVLTESGVVRSDIRSSFGSSSGTADGILTTIAFTVIDADSDAPLPGAAVYAWHCDREGRYSIYSEGAQDQNYLRGVQETGADGAATFTSIYPGCYAGRWPHVHFEVYASLADATSGAGPIATSQIALPEDVSSAVYATAGYEDSVGNASQVSLESDNVFSDGWEAETPTASGSVDEGYTIALTVGVTA
jgi:protocatechuate 3,4-dioxygenase beta subunit